MTVLPVRPWVLRWLLSSHDDAVAWALGRRRTVRETIWRAFRVPRV